MKAHVVDAGIIRAFIVVGALVILMAAVGNR